MNQIRLKLKTMLCMILCMLCVMTGCAGDYSAQNADWQEELAVKALEEILAEVESEYLAESEDMAQSEDKDAPRAEEENLQLEETAQAEENFQLEDIDQLEDIEQWEDIDQWENAAEENHDNKYIDREGFYTTAEDVALYLYTYDELPDNFMTKDEARELGWSGGSLEDYAPGMCIGGDYFGNYEGLLPEEPGRDYYECDINTLGADSRGAKRIVYSDDGLIYYTDDHYESFTLLYGEE